MTAGEPRWGRLAADLDAANVDATVTERPYAESVHGRVRHGVSRSIVIARPDGSTVEVHDKWWNKNPDIWVGWEVSIVRPDSITGRTWRWNKKRAEVVAAVTEAMVATGGLL